MTRASRSDHRVTVRVDGREYRVQDGDNLLHACLSVGLDLPYFCWHPALGSVGACRQCAVKQYPPEKEGEGGEGKLVMACMTPAAEGIRISIEDAEAADFRARVIEWLMVNHPHDCPVCDEGGECHLQDMTVMTGHAYRRYRFEKRTHCNQYLGPFLNHEMNRCIACYRCTRFYRDHAGGRDLDVFGAHDHVFFGRAEDGVLESEFAGNLVEVCPTGVFTDRTLKEHYTRKWDLQHAPSVCGHCAVGCNTIAGERYGGVRRILNRYHHEVNGYFLCDRGRFGYGFVNAPDRVRRPMLRDPSTRSARSGQARAAGTEAVRQRLAQVFRGGVWGIGSPRASLESNYALGSLVGKERFSTGLGLHEHELVATALSILRDGPARTPTLREVRGSDAVLVLGEDPSDTAPILALAIRQATRTRAVERAAEIDVPPWHDAAVREVAQDETSPLFTVTPTATRLDDAATETLRAGPEETARLAWAVARELDPKAPEVRGLDGDARELAGRIADALRGARRPVVVAGTGSGSQAVMESAAAVARALHRDRETTGEASPGLVLTLPEANSAGVGLLGGTPLETVFEAAERGEVETVIVLENDLFRRAPRERVEAFLDRVPHLVVLDHLETPTTGRAEILLPAATFAEGDGTLVSSEGRAQRFFQVYVPEDGVEIRESWRWLARVADAVDTLSPHGEKLPWRNLDEVIRDLADAAPVFARLPEVAPDASWRSHGLPVPREPHRASGRTAVGAHRNVHEPAPPEDPDAPLRHSMEGTRRQPPPALTPFYWSPGWNSVQALNKYQQEVGGPLRGGDPGVRLLEPDGVRGRSYAGRPPARPGGRLRVVPLHHVFGSEELSARSPAVAERSPEPYLALHPEDAAHLEGGILEGQAVELDLPDGRALLPVRFRSDLPRGVAGLPVGLPGSAYHALPAEARLIRRRGPAAGVDPEPGEGGEPS